MIGKSTLREIKNSLGRYLAILAIVALGVGLFAGLKITRPQMVATAQSYLEEKQFFDYRLLSTWGFEDQDVETFAGQEGVLAAQGAYSFDILCRDASGNESVLKAHSMTEGINGLQLLAGRMPEKASECVVDGNLFSEAQIGEKILLSIGNAPEDLENFKYQEYIIVGTVQSSYYIQFERGNTSLGNGKIAGFMYLLPEGFDSEYFTEIFVKFQENFDLYSEDYEDFLEEKEPVWEDLVQDQADKRYADTVAEAWAEIADARYELEEEQSKAQVELADAWEELSEAHAELTDGEQQLADAREEISDAWEEIAAREQELADGEQELLSKEQELQEAARELSDGQEQYDKNKEEVENRKVELEGQAVQIDMALAAGFMTPEAAAAAKAQIEAGKQMLSEADRELFAAFVELNSAAEQIQEGNMQLVQAREELADGRRQLEKARSDLQDAELELPEKEQELVDGWAEYEEGLKEYREGVQELETEVAEAWAEIADAEAEIADLEEPRTYVLGRNTNVGYVCFESDSAIVDGIADIFPVFFFLVAALVCMTTMNRMVEEQRTQIGVLKALGYSQRKIMFKYVFYSGSAALIGAVAGFMIGTWFFPWVIWYAYGIMYDMTSLQYVFDGKLALICLAVSLVCSIGTTWLSCRYALGEVAAQLMRPKAPKAGKRVLLERIPFLWNRLKFLHKVSVRNIFRYKKRFFMMIIGISGCTALLVTGFGVRDSVTNVARKQYDEIHVYDVAAVYAQEPDSIRKEELTQTLEPYASAWTFASELSLDLYTEDSLKSLNVIILQNPQEGENFVSLHHMAGNPVAYPGKDQVVICRSIAEDYDLRVGDHIRLRGESGADMEVQISGICENFIYHYIYLDAGTFREQTGEEPEFKSVFVTVDEGADVYSMSAALMGLEDVSSVTINDDMKARINSMMGSIDSIVLVIVLCAAALAFIVLYNLTNINITERIREIATVKVLGFYKKETASYVFRENTILSFIGAALGLILGYFMHQFVMSQVTVDMVTFDVHVQPLSYCYSFLLTLVFAWLINRLMTGKLEKIDMAESLKSVD